MLIFIWNEFLKTDLRIMPFRWLLIWSIGISIGWLISNHHYPWVGFHADAWMAIACLAGSAWTVARLRGGLSWHRLNFVVGLLICLSWLQHWMGAMPIIGNAWIVSSYLFGLLMAMLAGAHWETHRPSELLPALIYAILIASILSVGIQLKQWLEVDGLWLWVRPGDPARPAANLAQPNQLGTLILMGVLSSAWLLEKRSVRPSVAAGLAIFLLFGLALTSSRTAWIGLALIVVAAWAWRRRWRYKPLAWAATAMAVYFAACVNFILSVNHSLISGQTKDHLALAAELTMRRFTDELRLPAWTMFYNAIIKKPWLGYGVNQTATAHTSVAADGPPLGGNFTYAHNLLIDLLLWCGIPLGTLIFTMCVVWLWRRIRSVTNSDQIIAVMSIVIVANHAMFEMPLYYAYFLLPIGMIAGVLNVQTGATRVLSTPAWLTWFIWAIGGLLLALVIRDFMRVEPVYDSLTQERQNIQVKRPDVPDVLLLSQWRTYFEMARFEPKANLSKDKIQELRDFAYLYPSSFHSYTMAATMALNGQPEEAKLWLTRLCKMSPIHHCEAYRAWWEKQSLSRLEFAGVAWPTELRDQQVKSP